MISWLFQMVWKVDFYTGVEDEILSMPPKIQACMIKLLELIELHGANLGPPHTDSMGDGLLKLELKGRKVLVVDYFVI
jgi:phage-related protein